VFGQKELNRYQSAIDVGSRWRHPPAAMIRSRNIG
jgi:hypothetical protein